MDSTDSAQQIKPQAPQQQAVALIIPVLASISIVHLLNDVMQAVIPAMFPMLQQTLHLSYGQLGMIAFANNITASIMQPFIGWYTDKKPQPFLLLAGMGSTLVGMALLAVSGTLGLIVVAVMLVGLGSAVFHPEGSRIVSLSSGGKPGLAQSVFQVGGNAGQSLAPLMTIIVFAPLGQFGAMWFVGVAAVALCILYFLAHWYKEHVPMLKRRAASAASIQRTPEQQRRIRTAVVLIVFLSFARSWFIAGIGNFYALFQMKTFGTSLAVAQSHTFVFLLAGAVGTLFGGPLADRFGKKNILIFSILGCAPFALFVPFVGNALSYVLLALSGFAILTGFSVALIYALDLLPGKTGTVSGLMFGLAFGMGALGAVALGNFADAVGIRTMMIVCCALPFIGLLSFLLPDDTTIRQWNKVA